MPRLYLQNDLADVSTGFEVFVRRSRLREREYLVHLDLHLAGLYPRPNRGLDGLCQPGLLAVRSGAKVKVKRFSKNCVRFNFRSAPLRNEIWLSRPSGLSQPLR